MAKKRRRRGRRRSSRGGGQRIATGRDKAFLFAGGTLYGYFANHVAFFESLPTADAIGAPLSHGILLHFAAGASSGEIRRWLDLASVGAIVLAGNNLGKAKGDFAAAAAMSGIDDNDDAMRGHHLAGDVDYLEGDFPADDDDDDDDDEIEGDDDDDDDDEVEGDYDDEYLEEAA